MATVRRYPIGEQDFANIRRDDMIYVDKTALIYQISSTHGKYFFFRPRRLSKSLLLSTLRYYFEGRHDLFEGLAIDSLEQDWKKRPVIYLDLSRERTIDLSTLHSMIGNNLSEYEKLYQITSKDNDCYSTRLTNIIQEANKKSGEQVARNLQDTPFPTFSHKERADFSTSTRKIDEWKVKHK